MNRSCDVIVVGAGVVGATLACALGQAGVKVFLLDRKRPPAYRVDAEIDLRVFAISPASQRILKNVGAWPAIAAARISPYRHMHVWDATGNGAIDFDSADLGEAELGHIIENSLLQHALLDQATGIGKVTFLAPAEPAAMAIDEASAKLSLADGGEFNAQLIIAADGANSRLREMAGIKTRGWGYGQSAVVAHLSCEKSHQSTAWQRFMPTGPLALLPLADGRCSIVWSTTTKHAESLCLMDETAFCKEVSEASDYRLGKVTSTGRRASFPLQLLHAREYVHPRFALAGDAAHCVHPLAGQGVNLGLLDAAALTQVVLAARAGSRDPGAMLTLRRYERWRKGYNLAMMSAFDGFKRLFGNDISLLRWLRNNGLNAVSRLSPIKNTLMRRAMGLEGDLPDLAHHHMHGSLHQEARSGR